MIMFGQGIIFELHNQHYFINKINDESDLSFKLRPDHLYGLYLII
jgi:hypothetical protein